MTGIVVHVVGARPNFMKAAPVIRALRARGIEQRVVHTGQHYDAAMSDVFFTDLGLPEPDLNLGVGSGSQAGQTAALMVALEGAFAASTTRCPRRSTAGSRTSCRRSCSSPAPRASPTCARRASRPSGSTSSATP